MDILKRKSYIEVLMGKLKYYFTVHKDVALSAIIVGLLSHMYAITNKLVTADDVASIFSKGATVTSGRWFLGLTSIIFPDYSMPWIYGIICILLVVLSACMIVDFFEIRNSYLRVLTGALFASFPTITGFICYMFTAAPYCLGLVLAVYGINLIKSRQKTRMIIGVLLITLAAGIYQMYIVFTASMLVVYLIKRLAVDGKDGKEVLKEAVWLLLSLVAATVLYYVILKCSCLVLNIEAENADYGMAQMSLLRRLLSAYTAMAGIFIKGYFGYVRTWPSIVLHSICIVLILISCVATIREDKKRAPLLVLLLILWPLSVNALYLIASPGVIHVMSEFSFISFYMMVIVLSEKYIKVKDVTLASLGLIAALNIYAANATYLEIKLNNDTAYSYYTSLFANIYQTEGYKDGMHIIFVGRPEKGIYFNESPTEEISNLVIPVTEYYTTTDFIKHFLGRDVVISVLDYAELPEEMNVYPDYGSIQIIDDIVYVRMH